MYHRSIISAFCWASPDLLFHHRADDAAAAAAAAVKSSSQRDLQLCRDMCIDTVAAFVAIIPFPFSAAAAAPPPVLVPYSSGFLFAFVGSSFSLVAVDER